jgi:hypothetical protein
MLSPVIESPMFFNTASWRFRRCIVTDWKRKLSSHKFWALLTALITSLLTAFGENNATVIQVTGVIGAFGAVIAYILAEAYVGGKSAETSATDDL